MPILNNYSILEYNEVYAPDIVHLATSFAAKIAGDLGAEVIKVEPPEGDPVRRMRAWSDEEIFSGSGALFEFLNTSKKSVVLDMRNPKDLYRLKQLTARVDAVVTGSNHFDTLVEEWQNKAPKSVVKIMPFPDESGFKNFPVSEISIQALSGVMHLIGDPEREPLMLGGHQASFPTGYAAFTGLMAALASHQLQGKGDFVTLDVLSVLTWINWKAVAGAKFGLQITTREGSLGEWPVVPCKDGYVVLVYAFDKEFVNLAKVVGDERLLEPKFASFQGRAENREEYIAIIADWCRDRAKQEIYEQMQGQKVPSGPVLTPEELLTDAQYLEANFIANVLTRRGGTLKMPKVPIQVNGVSFSPAPAPSLGNAQEEIN